MHLEVLKQPQIELLPLLKLFRYRFYMAGGTAIALHLGHRYSLDFDLFSYSSFRNASLKNLLHKHGFFIQQILYEDSTQLNCLVNGVKLTFYQYPYAIEPQCSLPKVIKLPNILTLAAMKALALGGRGKWKDYVDLYHILNGHYRLHDVTAHANDLFGGAFNEKLFRQQLAYYDDVSFEEEVELIGNAIAPEDIKAYLTDLALTPFSV